MTATQLIILVPAGAVGFLMAVLILNGTRQNLQRQAALAKKKTRYSRNDILRRN